MNGAIWAIGELDDDRLVASSAGVASLASRLGNAAGRAAAGLVIGAHPEQAAGLLARYLPRVLSARASGPDGYLSPSALALLVEQQVRREEPALVLIPGTPGGKELAGALSARLQWGVLANAVDIGWADGPIVHGIAFRSDLRVRSRFTSDHGIVTVQPNVVTSVEQDGLGTVEEISIRNADVAGLVRRTERVSMGAPASVESARVVVAGGAGVGGRDSWRLVEELAVCLDGAVGASRPAVDAGWASLSQQIGQTGKSVRPDLYLALGISGEVQHRVGMRLAKTVVAVNTDREAPIGQVSDMLVVGDLHEIVPRLIAELRGGDDGE